MRPGTLLRYLVSLILLLSGCGAWEFVPDSTPHTEARHRFEAPERSTDFSTRSAVQAFSADSAQSADYRLGAGDEIYLEVVGRPELSGEHRIGPDGRITISVAGPVLLRNLTREEASAVVEKALSKYYKNIYSTIRVERYNSNRIVVIGRVENPGALSFDTPPYLLEVLAQAGGLPLLRKEQVLTRCSIIRGEKILWVDLKRLLTGDTELNVRLQRDDIVYIPDATDTSVYVMGEVHTPGVYRLTPQMSYLDALAQAGGPTEKADTHALQLIRPRKNVNMEMPMEEVLVPENNLNVAIEEGDIIFVPRSGVSKFGYILQSLNPFGMLFLVRSFALP